MKAQEYFIQYQRLVYKICRKYQAALASQNIDFEDAVQEGMLSLYKAAMRFNEDAGVAFVTYAYPYITGGVLTMFQNQLLLHVPRGKANIPVPASIHAPLADEFTLEDILRAEPDDTSSILLAEFLDGLTPLASKILRLRAAGYKQREIAAMTGVTQTQVSRYLKKLRLKYMAEYGGTYEKQTVGS